jgi:MFS family permease
MYLPIAFLPLCAPGWTSDRLMAAIVGMAALGGLMGNLVGPLWLSWMSDLIPAPVLNRYWGNRQRYLNIVSTAAFLGVCAFSYVARDLAARYAFPALCVVGCTAGTVDILLFLRVAEPEHLRARHLPLLPALLEPLRHPEYRHLLLFNVAFSGAVMLAAAFMQVYVVKELRVPVWQANLIWSMSGIGAFLTSRTWGRIADRHGHRPLLLACTLFKPAVCLVFMVITARTAPWILSVFYLFDGAANAGMYIATNGYVMTLTPRTNRSMYIAAATALPGIAGGLGAILGGYLLRHTQGVALALGGGSWTNYHLLFLASFTLRVLCLGLAVRVREAESDRTATVLPYLLAMWPVRALLFPFDLFRALRGAVGDADPLPAPREDAR